MTEEMDKLMQDFLKATEHDMQTRTNCLSAAVSTLEDIAKNGGQTHEVREKATRTLVAIAVAMTK